VSGSGRRVLVTLHDPGLNGATISILRVVPLLEREGWRFAFWVPRPGAAHDRLLEQGAEVFGEWRPIVSGLQPLRLPPGPARRLAATPGYLRRFARLARRIQPDVVHANSLFSFAEALTTRMLGIPTLMQLHDMAPTSWKARVAAEICRNGVNEAIAVSKACADSYSIGAWRPQVVYGGAPLPDSTVEVRERPRPFTVGTVGVISRRKATDVFVDAAASLLSQGDGFAFHLIGGADDPLDRAWAGDVVTRAQAAGIRYERRADVLAAMRGWDAFVLPSRIDPFPIVMLEAMGSGLPVVGAATDGIAEQITPETGRLVPAGQPAALAGAISSLAGEPREIRAAMGAAARERIERRFTLERQAEGLAVAYEGLLEGH